MAPGEAVKASPEVFLDIGREVMVVVGSLARMAAVLLVWYALLAAKKHNDP